jgi:hypothetical protein
MKRLILTAVFGATAILAGCDSPASTDAYGETGTAPEEAPVAPVVEDIPVPETAPAATDTPPVDSTTVPPEKRTSAETVRPESETLFY